MSQPAALFAEKNQDLFLAIPSGLKRSLGGGECSNGLSVSGSVKGSALHQALIVVKLGALSGAMVCSSSVAAL